MPKPVRRRAEWPDIARTHSSVFKSALGALVHSSPEGNAVPAEESLPEGNTMPSEESLVEVGSLLSGDKKMLFHKLKEQIALLSVLAHRLRWSEVRGWQYTDIDREAAYLAFTLAVGLLEENIHYYNGAESPDTFEPEYCSTPNDIMSPSFQDYTWPDTVDQVPGVMFCALTGQSSVLVPPSGSVTHGSDIFNATLGCTRCIKAKRICVWPDTGHDTPDRCVFCTRDCTIHDLPTARTEMTVLAWKDTAMGQKVIAGLAAEKAFTEVWPAEFAMQLRQITASVERLSETTAVVAQLPSELDLAANLVGRASAHLMSGYYPTQREFPKLAAHWGLAP